MQFSPRAVFLTFIYIGIVLCILKIYLLQLNVGTTGVSKPTPWMYNESHLFMNKYMTEADPTKLSIILH
jgi:hypothetical protein